MEVHCHIKQVQITQVLQYEKLSPHGKALQGGMPCSGSGWEERTHISHRDGCMCINIYRQRKTAKKHQGVRLWGMSEWWSHPVQSAQSSFQVTRVLRLPWLQHRPRARAILQGSVHSKKHRDDNTLSFCCFKALSCQLACKR